MTTRSRIRANVGDHVLATKYSDGHAGDPWVVGIVTEIFVDDYGARCLCLADGHNNTRLYRRAIRIKSNDEAEHLLQAGKYLKYLNPLKSMYSVLGEYRKKKKPFLTHDPEAIDD